MLRLLKYLFLFIVMLLLVTIAMGNRDPMTVQLLPDGIAQLAGINFDLTLPTFIMVLAIFLTGLLFGFVWEWVREAKHRSTAKVERRERQRLEQEVNKVAPPAKTGDDVLAILDGR